MRILHTDTIINEVAAMCLRANSHLPHDMQTAFAKAADIETGLAKEIFHQLVQNYELAGETGLPLCQDTGLAVFFVELGQNLHINGLCLPDAIHKGVRLGYEQGYLRKSVCFPLSRENTGDNTPAIIHLEIVPGDTLRIVFMAKGGGSENMSSVTMLTPSAGVQGIREAIRNQVQQAGANTCPPIVVGVGIGGSFDRAPILAKKALLRAIGSTNADTELAQLEKEILAEVNATNIGAMGFGGKITAFAVHILAEPCHIASLPLAVNMQCHSARHDEVVL